MSQTANGIKTFEATEILEGDRRVKLTAASGTFVEYADASDGANWIGTTNTKAEAIGDHIGIILKTTGRTIKIEVDEASVAGAPLYATDDGKCGDSDPGSGVLVVTALEDASASGSIIEALAS